jgi:hypothetical protein
MLGRRGRVRVMAKRRRQAGRGKRRASPEAEPRPPLSDSEIRLRVAGEELLDQIREVARQIDQRVRRVMGDPGLHGPGQGEPDRGQPGRGDHAGAQPDEGEH